MVDEGRAKFTIGPAFTTIWYEVQVTPPIRKTTLYLPSANK